MLGGKRLHRRPGGRWGHLEVDFLQPLGEPPGEPLSIVLRAEGAAPGVGLAAQQCLAPTVGLNALVTPEGQGIGQIHIGKDGCARAALGGPGRRGDALALRLPHPSLQPLADEVQRGPRSEAHTQHGPQPGVVHLVAEALEIGLPQGARASVLQIAGEGSDRSPRSASGSLGVTALQKSLRIACRQQRRPGQLPHVIFERRSA